MKQKNKYHGFKITLTEPSSEIKISQKIEGIS